MQQRRIRPLHPALLRRGLAAEFDPRQEMHPRARPRGSRAPRRKRASAEARPEEQPRGKSDDLPR